MRVTIEFVGGPMDGTVTIDPAQQPTDPAGLFAWMFYGITDGQVGSSSMGVPPHTLMHLKEGALKTARTHGYCVVERQEVGADIRLKAEAFE